MVEEGIKKVEIKTLIEKELSNIKLMMQELEEYEQQNSRPFRRAKASLMHDFYNCCERIFKIIAFQINTEFQETPSWHKNLLYRMTIEIKGIRPIVISQELAAELDEFLGFRHLFRNIYGFELQTNRLDYLIKKFKIVAPRFIKEIKNFLKKI